MPASGRTIVPRGMMVPAARLVRADRHVLVKGLAALVAGLSLVPLLFVAWVTVEFGWVETRSLVLRPRVGELLVNTVSLVALTIPFAILLAVALAWLIERTDLPGTRLWSWLAVAPLGVPAFVHSYAWISLVPKLHGLWGCVLVAVLAYFPFLYLPIAAQMRRLDPALEDAAGALGLEAMVVFRRVVLPQLRLAICGGSLLIGLHLLAEYGLFAMIQFDTFTVAIVEQFQSTYAGPAANMLAGVLILCSLGLLGLDAILRGRERYARVGVGAARLPRRHRLGGLALPCLLVPLVTSALALGVPFVTLTRWLLAGGTDIWRLDEIGTALAQTMAYAFAGAALTTVAALPMAWLSIRARGHLQRLFEACHYYVGSLPGVVVALALVAITVRVMLPLYQTLATILLAYALLFLPRALTALRGSIAQAPIELEQAAMALGRTPLIAFTATTLRLAAPGFAASLALVAMGITTELTATLMLAPNGTSTLATEFWSRTSELDYAAAAPYALAMIMTALPMMMLLHAQSRRLAGS